MRNFLKKAIAIIFFLVVSVSPVFAQGPSGGGGGGTTGFGGYEKTPADVFYNYSGRVLCTLSPCGPLKERYSLLQKAGEKPFFLEKPIE